MDEIKTSVHLSFIFTNKNICFLTKKKKKAKRERFASDIFSENTDVLFGMFP